MFIFVWFLIPETKGLSLERMDELFGVTELEKHIEDVEAGAAPVAAAREINFDGKEAEARVENVELSGRK